MLRRLLLLTAVIVVLGFAPAPFPKTHRVEAKKALLDQMQGWWAHTEERNDGRPDMLFNLRVHIQDKTLQYYVGEGKADGWTITVDETTQPPSLDKTSLTSTTTKYPARVTVAGDTMKIAWMHNGQRPDDVSGARGRAITFKRERK